MRYTTKTPCYDVDLSLDESERWLEVIAAERSAARRLEKSALESLSGSELLVNYLGPVFRATYATFGGRYLGEIDCWAEAMRLTSSQALVLNCSYELSHASGYYGSRSS